jgi:hypothetical protein
LLESLMPADGIHCPVVARRKLGTFPHRQRGNATLGTCTRNRLFRRAQQLGAVLAVGTGSGYQATMPQMPLYQLPSAADMPLQEAWSAQCRYCCKSPKSLGVQILSRFELANVIRRSLNFVGSCPVANTHAAMAPADVPETLEIVKSSDLR